MVLIPEHDANCLDAKKITDDYYEFGVVIVKNAIPPELRQNLLSDFDRFIRYALDRNGETCKSNLAIDELDRKLAASDPKTAERLLGIGREFPSYLRLITAPKITEIGEKIFGGDQLQIVFDKCVCRVDRPNHDKTNLEWHQDYPYNMLASDAGTFWIPLTEITPDVGPLRVVPRSHKMIETIELDYDALTERFNPKYMSIANLVEKAPKFEKTGVDVTPVEPGSVILLHALAVHRSGFNRSRRNRWVALARFGRFADHQLEERSWFTARSKYPLIFKDHHPEHITYRSQS